jgi:hypothetical protein
LAEGERCAAGAIRISLVLESKGEEEEEEEEIIRLPCLVGRVAGPLLAARALPLRCAASTMLSSTLLAI